MYKLIKYLVVILFFSSCQPKTGGIVFSFDDDHFESWYNIKGLLKEYNIKATFFITRVHLMDSTDVFFLKELEKEGHEVAAHSLTHKNVLEFKGDLKALLKEEILPVNQILKSFGFSFESYAYPFGKSNHATDSLLLNHYTYLRKATYNYKDTLISAYDEIYISNKNQRITNAMGIDANYNISLKNFEDAIIRAKNNGEILVVYAHNITKNPSEYEIDPKYLEETFKLCKKHEIQSVSLNQVSKFWNH